MGDIPVDRRQDRAQDQGRHAPEDRQMHDPRERLPCSAVLPDRLGEDEPDSSTEMIGAAVGFPHSPTPNPADNPEEEDDDRYGAQHVLPDLRPMWDVPESVSN